MSNFADSCSSHGKPAAGGVADSLAVEGERMDRSFFFFGTHNNFSDLPNFEKISGVIFEAEKDFVNVLAMYVFYVLFSILMMILRWRADGNRK